MDDAPAKGRILTLTDWERYQYRYALLQCYRAERAYQNIIAQDLRPLWRALPSGWSLIPSLLSHNRQVPRSWDECNIQVLHDDDPDSPLAKYRDAVHRVVRDQMRLVSANEPAEWAAAFVHADVTADMDGPHDPGVGINYRTFEAALRIEVSPARARVRLVQPYDPDDPMLVPMSRDYELASRTIEAARWFSFEEWDQLAAQVFNLYRLWEARMQQFWTENYQYRYGGTMENRQEDIRRIFAYLFKREKTYFADRADRLRMQRMARSLGIDLF